MGETFEDIIFHDLQQWPQLGQEFRTDHLLRTWGGGALLTAVAASRQGLATRVVSALAAGAATFLRREKVKVSNLRRAGEPHAVTVALSTRQDRAFVTYPGVNQNLEERFLGSLVDLQAQHLHLALEPHNCLEWSSALENLRIRGITTSWDFGWNPDLPQRNGFERLLQSLDYVFLNQAESQLYATESPWEERCRCTVIKLGRQGSLLLAGQQRLESPGLEVEAVDSTGAGDAFNGGFLAGLLEGREPLAAMQLGNQLGAASTLCAGGLDGLPRR